MTITPSVLISAHGLCNGEGLVVSPTMTNLFSKIQTQTILGSALANINSVGFGNTITSLPSGISTMIPTMNSVTSHANNILPSGVNGIKKFVNIFNNAASYGSMAGEFGAALVEFEQKLFADFGIAVTEFKGIVSSGVSSLVKDVTSDLKTSLKTFGNGVKNMGKLYDMYSPYEIGTQVGLIKSLKKQGLLTSTSSFYQTVKANGYSIDNDAEIKNIPTSVIDLALQSMTQTEIDAVLQQTGAKPITALTSGMDFLDSSKFIEKDALKAFDISTISGKTMDAVGNVVNNIGAPGTKIGEYMTKMEIANTPTLDSLTSVIPPNVKDGFKNLIGAGSSLVGTLNVNDMLGTVAGNTHIDSFSVSHELITEIDSRGWSNELAETSAILVAAVTGGNASIIANAAANVTTAAYTLSSLIAGEPALSELVTSNNNAMTTSSSKITAEITNLAKAGVDLNDVAVGSGMGSLLAISSRLHNIGIDKQGLGIGQMFSQICAPGLAGDAIKASLIEGRNILRNQVIGKASSAIANQAETLAKQATSQLGPLQKAADKAVAKAITKGTDEAKYLAEQAIAQTEQVERISKESPI